MLLLPSTEAADLPNVDLETMRNQLRVAARDLPPLKTEYYESATNGAAKINYKLWKTVRGGQLLMTREERDITGDGTFSSIDYLVYHNGQKVFQFTSVEFSAVERRRLCIFYPVSGAQAMQSDSDGDGRYDKLTIMDDRDKSVETFAIAPDGRLTPNREADLKEELEALERAEKDMKKLLK